MTNEHTFLEKYIYISRFIRNGCERVMCESELETEQTATY